MTKKGLNERLEVIEKVVENLKKEIASIKSSKNPPKNTLGGE